MSGAVQGVRRGLLVRPDRIGDVVISTACLRALHEAWPAVEWHWLAQAPVLPLLEGHPVLAGVQALPQEGSVALRTAALSRQIAQLAPDVAVLWEPDSSVEAALCGAGVPRRIGFVRQGVLGLTDGVAYAKKSGGRHEAQYCFDLLEGLGIARPDVLLPWLHPQEAARERLAAKCRQMLADGEGYAVLHLGAHGKKPRLPVAFFVEVGLWLRARGMALVVVGGEAREPLLADFLSGVGDGVCVLCGQLDLAETAWLLAGARLIVSRDSGPAHLGAAMGAPTLTVFAEPGPGMDAARWAPLGRCSAVYERQDVSRRWWESRQAFAQRAMRGLCVAEVEGLLELLLGRMLKNPIGSG